MTRTKDTPVEKEFIQAFCTFFMYDFPRVERPARWFLEELKAQGFVITKSEGGVGWLTTA